MQSSFSYRPAVYSVQFEVKPVLCQTRLSIHFPQNEFYTDVGVIFKQQAAVSEVASANTVFWEEL